MSESDSFDGDGVGKHDTLGTIIEMPSGSSAGGSTADLLDQLSEGEEEIDYNNESEEENDPDEMAGRWASSATGTSSFKKKKKKFRSRNGDAVDMTPPEKLLKRAEGKTRQFIEKKKIDKAIKELVRCTALSRIIYRDGHWQLAKSHTRLAQAYLDLKGYAVQAEFHTEHAKSMLMGAIQTTSSSSDKSAITKVLLNTYYILGRSQTILKKYNEAEKALMRAVKISRERNKLALATSDECDMWDIKVGVALAKLSGKQQKHAMATRSFEKSLELIERQHGMDSMELVPIYQGLGAVEQSKGKHADHEKAIEYFLQAHSIAAANYKGTSVEVAETAYALATAYSNTGDIEGETSAESYLNECLATYQAVYGPIHEKTLLIQDELARLMIRTDRQDEGVDLLRSTIQPKQDLFGEYSEQVAETYKLLGSIHLSKGSIDKAVKVFKKCQNLETMLYGSNHRKTKDTQRTLDILLSNPAIASKHPKTKAEGLKDRPRFA